MTSVLVIDTDAERRADLEAQLQDSNQFGAIHTCETLAEATRAVEAHAVEVVLIDKSLAANEDALETFKSDCPNVGIVVIAEPGQGSDSTWLDSVGAHAQTNFSASPMEVMASVAKALVRRFKPKKSEKRGLLRRFMND